MGLIMIIVACVYDFIKGCNNNASSKKKQIPTSTYRDENGVLVASLVQTWEEIKRQMSKNNLNLGRDVITAKRYHSRMIEIAREWRSISDYCKHTYLNYPIAKMENSNGITVKYVTDNVMNDTSVLHMARNDFPYYVTEGINHFVLWSSKEQDWKVYEDYVTTKFPRHVYDVLMFENPIELKSVKSVVHVHVFVRLREHQ